MTYRTGSIGEFMKWMKRVVKDPATATASPKRWFDNDATATKALGATMPPEAMVKLLSEENLALLHLIASAPSLGERTRDARGARGTESVAHARKAA
jgi:hypothetical protein